MSDHASSSAQDSAKNLEGEWVRGELRETKKISTRINEKISKVDEKLEEMMMMMEKMMVNKSKHGEGSSRKKEYHRDPHYQKEVEECSNPCYRNSYTSPLKHNHKPQSHPHSRKPKVDLPYFNGHKNVEEYLQWEKKVEKTFEYHQIEEYRRLSMATLSFQENAMIWWEQRKYDVIIGRKSEILSWNELKVRMRRKFVPPSYEKNKKIREEMKEFVIKGRKFIDGEKDFVRREKEFREKVQALIRKKEEEKKRQEREEKKKREREKRKRRGRKDRTRRER